MGGQRGTWVSGLIIRVMALKGRALYQYGVGGRGVCRLKKIFGNSPCQFLMSGGENYFFIRHSKIVFFFFPFFKMLSLYIIKNQKIL